MASRRFSGGIRLHRRSIQVGDRSSKRSRCSIVTHSFLGRVHPRMALARERDQRLEEGEQVAQGSRRGAQPVAWFRRHAHVDGMVGPGRGQRESRPVGQEEDPQGLCAFSPQMESGQRLSVERVGRVGDENPLRSGIIAIGSVRRNADKRRDQPPESFARASPRKLSSSSRIPTRADRRWHRPTPPRHTPESALRRSRLGRRGGAPTVFAIDCCRRRNSG